MQNILHQNEPLNMRQCVELSAEENDGKLLFQRTEKKKNGLTQNIGKQKYVLCSH